MSERRPCTFTRTEIEVLRFPARNFVGARLEDGVWWGRWRYYPREDYDDYNFEDVRCFSDSHDYGDDPPIPDEGWELCAVNQVVVEIADGILMALRKRTNDITIDAMRPRLDDWLRDAIPLVMAEVELWRGLRKTSPLDAVRGG